jgi:hypothetical protein
MEDSKVSRAEKRAARKAAQEAPAPKQEFDTAGEANEALADTARVINMKQKVDEKAAAQSKKERKAPFGKLPSLPRSASAKKPKPTRPCECGCNGETKSRFMPGHDSYFRGLIIRVQRDIMTLKDVEEKVGPGQRVAVEAHLKALRAKERKEAKEA